MRTPLVVCLACVSLVFACKSKDDKAKPATHAPPTKPADGKPAVVPPITAKPVKKKPPAVVERPDSFHVALRKGRDLSAKRDFKGALAAFDVALAAVPGDARALSEVSWVALQMKDYPRARKTAEQAVANAKTRTVKASSLYNLGRALEELGDKKAALAAYEQSHAARPHKAVSARITKLGGKVVAALNVTPTPMQSVTDPQRFDLDQHWGEQMKKPVAPFESAYVVEDQQGNGKCDLNVKVAGGSYVVYGLMECPGNNKYFNTSVSTIEVKTAGTVPVLVLSYTEGQRDYAMDKNGERQWTTNEVGYTVYCGVGASGKPSCTPAIATKRAETDESPKGKSKVSLDLSLALEAGKLVVTDSGKKTEYPLAFP